MDLTYIESARMMEGLDLNILFILFFSYASGAFVYGSLVYSSNKAKDRIIAELRKQIDGMRQV